MADRPLGSLFVTVAANVAGFTKGMTRVEQASNKTRTKLRGGLMPSVTGVSGAMNLFAGVAAVGAAKALFELGTRVEETNNKFNVILGTTTELGEEFVKSFAALAGMSETAVKDSVANLVLLGTGMGLSADEALDLAMAAQQVAGDLTSINNIPLADTTRAITSALVGETESMKRLTGPITQLQVKTKALELGLIKEGEALTSSARAAATLKIAAERLGPALGDMVATQDSAAAGGRDLAAAIESAKLSLGESLLPVMPVIVNALTKMVHAIELSFIGLQKLVVVMKMLFAASVRNFSEFPRYIEELGQLGDAAEIAWEKLVLPATSGDLATTAAAVDKVTENARGASIAIAAAGEASAATWEPAGRAVSDIYVPAVTALGLTLEQTKERQRLMNAETDAATEKTMIYAQAVTGLFAAFRGGGSIFSKIGSVIGALAPLLAFTGVGAGVIAGIGAGSNILRGFAGGGFIPSGSVGVVGEQGPELAAGPNNIIPNGQMGGDIHITIVAENGRQIVDTVRVKATRDTDVRRIARIPLAAMATG